MISCNCLKCPSREGQRPEVKVPPSGLSSGPCAGGLAGSVDTGTWAGAHAGPLLAQGGLCRGQGALALLSVAMSVQEPGQTLWPMSRSKCMIYPFEGRAEGARRASPQGVGKDAELQAAM